MKIGFIGTGNMGGAIMSGYIKSNPQEAENVCACNHSQAKVEALAKELGFKICKGVAQVVECADMIVLAVKPNIFPEILPQVKTALASDKNVEKKMVVSIAAGVTLEHLEKELPEGLKIVRVMPNTPAMVKEGMASLSPNGFVDEVSLKAVLHLFESCGKAEVVKESLIDAVIAVSGSSPAYVYMFIEALGDAAVAEGMPRKQAYKFAAQAVLGSAKMVLETGLHPGELKDQVCSPGGSTIESVAVLEAGGMRSTVMEAARAAAEKSREMSKK